jgi:pilus assembly protein CpaB
MSPRQIIVLGVALVAALGALLLVNSLGKQRAVAAPVEQISGQNVLVAARDVPQGAALTPQDMRFARFPETAVSEHFIVGAQGGASVQDDYVGAVTRRTFVAGEPFTRDSIIQPEGRGFMAAEIPPGYRAVAVPIDSKHASGGFISPNDHVDVVLTQRVKMDGDGANEEVRSDVILEDVRVLALDEKTQPQSSGEEPERNNADIAVLELSVADARILALADALGSISLVLRGVEAEDGVRAPSKLNRGTRALDQNVERDTVRVHAFGTVGRGG